MRLSVIIVNYNTFTHTFNTIQSVISSINDTFSYEILLIDNNSTTEVKQQLKDSFENHKIVKLILNKSNDGFSTGNNIGIRQAAGEYILLLNSDTLIVNQCISLCLDYLSVHPNIGALGCKLLLANGELDHACKRGFPSPEASLYYFLGLHKIFPDSKKFCQYTLSYQDINTINEVDSLTGAFMLIPRSVIDQVGLLDESFFMYGEDLDWCYRMKEAGYKIVYYPYGETIHLKGQSSKKKRVKTIYEFHRAMLLFYKKHYKKKYPRFISLVIYLSIYVRMGLTYILNLFRK